MKTIERIKTLMAKVFEVNVFDIADNTTPELIENWNSLKHMELVVALEEEFKITFEDDQIIELISLDAINTILSERMNGL